MRILLQPDSFTRRVFELEKQGKLGAKPATPNLYPQTGPWSGNQQLGAEAPFAPDANNEQTILKLDEWGFPNTWTIALGLTGGDSGALNYEVTALMNFGCGGVTQQIEVDWQNGAMITLPMNALNVIARYSLATGLPTDLKLRVNVSKYSGSENTANRTLDFTAAAGTTSTPVKIPPFASRLFVVPGGTTVSPSIYAAASASLVEFLSSSGGVVVSFMFANQLLNWSNGLIIPRNARFVRWNNLNAFLENGRFVFQIL